MNIISYLKSMLNGISTGYQIAKTRILIARLPQPCVTIFGSSRINKDNPYVTLAYQLAYKLAQNGYGVITGGGPAIMVAANWGATEGSPKGKAASLGIGIKGVDVGFVNDYASIIVVDSFSIRKELLSKHSQVHIFFPGGVGSVDEMFTILNEMKHNVLPRQPIILFGVSYWQSLITWYEQAIEQGYINSAYRSFFVAVDSVDEVVALVNTRKGLTAGKA